MAEGPSTGLVSSQQFREFWILDDAQVFGGGQLIALRLARYVNESLPSCAAHVVCPRESELAARCGAVDVLVHHATFPGFEPSAPITIPRAALRLRHLLEGADGSAIALGMSLRTQVYAHSALLGMRDAPRLVHFMPEQDSARRLTTRFVFRRNPAVVAVGENAADAYRARIPGVRIHVVNNFLLPEEFDDAARRVTRKPDTHAPVLGVLARLIPEKGILEAVEELASASEHWSRLLIGGQRQDQAYVRAVQERIRQLGLIARVRLLGRIDDVSAFFDQIDALLVPSVGNEGQPVVIVEAIAHGRPVIVREPIWSKSFGTLPVLPYRDVQGLRTALTRLPPPIESPEELKRLFGPMQAIDAIEEAAGGLGRKRHRRA